MNPRDHWQNDKQVARAILADRQTRRRWLAGFLMLALGQFVLGLWVVDDWLAGGAWRFLLWWSACGVVTLWLMLFALYDALMVIREEKKR